MSAKIQHIHRQRRLTPLISPLSLGYTHKTKSTLKFFRSMKVVHFANHADLIEGFLAKSKNAAPLSDGGLLRQALVEHGKNTGKAWWLGHTGGATSPTQGMIKFFRIQGIRAKMGHGEIDPPEPISWMTHFQEAHQWLDHNEGVKSRRSKVSALVRIVSCSLGYASNISLYKFLLILSEMSWDQVRAMKTLMETYPKQDWPRPWDHLKRKESVDPEEFIHKIGLEKERIIRSVQRKGLASELSSYARVSLLIEVTNPFLKAGPISSCIAFLWIFPEFEEKQLLTLQEIIQDTARGDRD